MKWFKKEEQKTEPPIRGYMISKCKRCSEISKCEKDLQEFSLWLQYGSIYYREIHKCADGNIGIEELIGFEINK